MTIGIYFQRNKNEKINSRNIQIIYVYSGYYAEMQKHTKANIDKM